MIQNAVIFFKDSSFNHRFDEVGLIFLQEILFKLLYSTRYRYYTVLYSIGIYVYYMYIFKSSIPTKKELTAHYGPVTSANGF